MADARWFNTYIHGAVFVLILGFIDAGYSRDWTRIGAITPEFEQQLRDWAGRTRMGARRRHRRRRRRGKR